MAKKELKMEMGNLVCRFGEKKVLVDLFEEIVLPSFTDKGLIRTYSKTSYFFYKTSLIKLADGSLAVVGRFIKDTTLEREQIFEEGKGLIEDAEEMRSSPSGVFVLLVDIHRLIYVKETKNAPSMESFRSTLQSFLSIKHKRYIDKKYNELSDSGEKVTKKSLIEETPKPSVELIPLTSGESIDAFIRNYEVLKTVEYRFSDRNDESDNDPFFEQVQKRKDSVGSTSTVVKHANGKGLNKQKVISEVKEATKQGNQYVNLSGKDSEGDTLKGNNESFQLKKPIVLVSKKPKAIGEKLYETFKGLISDGVINVPTPPKSTIQKLSEISQRLLK